MVRLLYFDYYLSFIFYALKCIYSLNNKKTTARLAFPVALATSLVLSIES